MSISFAQAQELSRHNWYFGNSTQALRFDRTTNAVERISKNLPQPFGIGGAGVATDHTNRNLLFYTDGTTIYDFNGAVMPNGAALGGASVTNQPVALCPIPGQVNQFYVFTRDGGGTVTVSTVDMNQFGNSLFPAPASGDVTLRNQSVGAGLSNRSEAMLLVSSPLDTAYWLITQEVATNNYTVTSITDVGITNTVVGGIGFPITAANFSHHAGTGRIAVAPADADANIAILNFNNATGALTFNEFIFNTSVNAVTEPGSYDTEWSLTGRFLYISRTGEAGIQGDVLQHDFLNPTITLASVLPAPNTIFKSWGLQMAPDSSIYHLYQASAGGAFRIGRLSDADSVAIATTYTPQAFINIDFVAKQFPAFAPKARITLNISFVEQGLCSNTTTTFFPTVTPGADSLVWDFGDGSFSTSWSPVYTYTAGGTFPVRVRAFLKGDTASFTKDITITQFDLTLNLVQDTTACECELPINNGVGPCPNDTSDDFSVDVEVQGGTPTSFQWFGPGGILSTQTSATLRPDSAGFYYVVVTDATGCSAYAGVTITEYGLEDQRANIWYFGNRAGIDFNDGTVPISNTVMDAPEGCSIVCDQNGQTIFFTDGNSVWDRDFVELATGIGGNLNSTQSVFIMPVAGDETLYYIFTTQEIFGSGTFELRYSLFDLKANNGQGDVVQQSIPLFSKSTERLTGNGNWLLAHEFGNNSFRAYNVSALGIGSPVISSVGSDHTLTNQQNGEGYMKLGAQNRLAVSLSTPGVSNVVEVFDFDNGTGIVSNFRSANLNNPVGQVYGVEFSPGGNKLYATLSGATSQLVEFAIDSVGIPYLKQPPFPTVSNRLGAIQTGPDGQIYVAVDGQAFLGTITPNEDTTQVSAFTLNSFALLGGTTSRLGLPNFAQNLSSPAQQPSISVSGVCLGSPTVFAGSGTNSIDELTWFFGDGASATGDSATHTYAAAGDYLVSLQITNRCGLDTTLTRQITIVPPPANPTFLPAGVVPVLCTGSLLLEATPATNPSLSDLSFLWTTGDTTRTLLITQQTIIGVTITDINGCSSNGSLLVADNRPQVELGPDLTICQDTPIAPLDAQNPGTTYAWTVNGASPSATQTRNVDTTAPGIFEYRVTVLDPFTTCTVSDSVSFTINPTPVFTATAVDATGCATTDGQINLTITSTGAYSYFISGPSTAIQDVNQAGPSGVLNFPGLPSGSFGVTVSDELSGCPASTVVGIANAAITVTTVQNGTCDPITISVTHNVGASAFSYRVLDPALTSLDNGVSAVRATPFSTNTIPSNNTYVVEITRTSDGCVSSSLPLTLTQAPQVTISGFTTSCGPSGETIVTVSTPDATTFDWSASQAGSIVGATTGASVTLNPGTWNLSVTADNATLCPTTSPFVATGASPFTASLAQTDPCQSSVTLNASPTGSFTYLWTRTPAPDPVGGQSLALTTADDNATYGVTVRSTISGCTNTSPTLQVNVVGEFSVTLASTPPCEGTPFTITATTTQLPTTTAWTLNGSTITGATTTTLQDTRDGVYEVTVARDVCTATEDIQITNAPTTAGLMVDNALICNDPGNPDPSTSTVVLNPGPGFSSFEWFKDGVTLNEFTPTFTAEEPGIFSVNLVNVFGCPSSDRTTIVFECDPRIVAPTAFRPGSANPLTKDFFVFSYFIADEGFEVFIFNRWGEMIFQSNDPDFRWNGGRNNGALLPAGTYTYVVKYKSSFATQPGIREQRGGVVLVR